MAYDSAATRRRLLDAAYAEFAARGLAGARVDRIAAEAGANKQAIYAYFGSKDGLFDAALEKRLGVLADAVPFTPNDIPGYVGTLFDHMSEDPSLVRLTQWKLLERADAGDAERESHLGKAQEVATATGVDAERGMDILILVLSLAQAWSVTAPAVRGKGKARLARHRTAAVTATAAVVAALTTQPAT